MSKTVDERVVSMQFDNKHFEKNVQTSMSTLDKLKAKLNLSGASKGLENVNAAAKNVNMSPLSQGVEAVRVKFSALQVMAVTALSNITNSAVNAGKRMVEALTIAPIKDGFQEYEMTLNAVQTTMAGTGKTAEEVEKELKKLDEYADQTVYSTADMLNNLPKFTNAGVDLEVATKAMIGIANATAHAGGDASKASIAFYNLGQAIGTGYLTRMDYNSINNAGIATMEWKNQMVKAAIASGTLTKAGEDLYTANGRNFTLQQLFIDGLQEQWATTEVMTKVFGDYGDEQTEIGKKAYESATKIKTFSMMMDSLKASAGTGWKDTWQLIFGNLDAATEFWTGLYKFLGGIIDGMNKFRNGLLKAALGSPFGKMADDVKRLFDKIQGTVEVTKNATKKFKDLGNIVNRVIGGEFGNGQTRFDALTKAGYNWMQVQNKVNEELGCSYRYNVKLTESEKELGKAKDKNAKSQELNIEKLVEMSDAQLKALGLTTAEIEALREVEKRAKQAGIPLKDVLENVDLLNGRTLLINSFKNAGQGLVSVFNAMKDAWVEIFPPPTTDQLYGIIAGLHKFSLKLKVGKKTADNLKRTFKGLFALFDILLTLVGGPLKVIFKVLGEVLSAFGLDIWDLTAMIGDGIVMFRDWIDSLVDFGDIALSVIPSIKKIWNAMCEWFEGLKKADNIPQYILMGLVNGITSGASWVWNSMSSLITGLIDTVKNLLGIHSPSVVFAAIGGFIIAGLLTGIQNGFPSFKDGLSAGFNSVIEFIKNIDLGSVIAGVITGGIIMSAYKIADGFQSIGNAIGQVGEFVEDTGEGVKATLKGLGKAFKGVGFKLKMDGIKSLAIAIAILVGCIVVLSLIDPGKAWAAVGIIATLAAVMAGMAIAIDKWGAKTELQLGKFALAMLAIGVSLLIVASAVKKLSGLSWEEWAKGLGGVVILMGAFVGIFAATQLVAKGANDFGKTILKVAAALLLMLIVVKYAGKMSPGQMEQGILAMAAFGGIIVGLMAATKLLTGSKNIDKIGSTILKIGAAMLLMVFVAKIASKMTPKELIQGTLAIAAFAGIITGLMAATKLLTGSVNVEKIGGAILKIAVAMLAMVFVAKIAGNMEPKELIQGTLAITAFGGIIVGLMYAIKMLGGAKQIEKLGSTLLLISVSIAVIAAVATLLGLIPVKNLLKGIVAMTALAGVMAGLIAVTKFAQKCKDELIVLTVTIGVLGLAIAALSFIDPRGLAAASAALSIVMGVFSLLILATSKAQKCTATLIIMTTAIAVLGGVLYLLGLLNPGAVLSSAVAIGVLLAAMAASMLMLDHVKSVSASALGTMAVLGLVVAELAVILGIMSALGVEGSIPTAIALSILLTTMVSVLVVLALMGSMASSAYAGIGAMAVLGLVVGELALILGLMSAFNVAPSLTTVAALSVLLVTMAAVLPILAVVGVIGTAAIIGVGVLAVLIAAIGGLLIGIGALMNEFPQLEEFLDKGMPVMEKIGYALGSFVGNIVGGLLSGITGALPKIGEDLSAFMEAAKPFIDGAKSIDDKAMSGVLSLAEVILVLTGASILEGLTSWFTGGADMVAFGEKIAAFGPYLAEFGKSVKDIDGKKIKAAATAALSLTEFASSIPNEGGWLGKIMGENDIEKFGEKLAAFGPHFAEYAKSVKDVNPDVVKTSADAATALSDFASSLPNSGGWLGKVMGENDIDMFGEKLAAFGPHFADYAESIKDIDPEVVKTSANAAQSLSDFADSIPNTGGLVAAITGDNDIAVFGAKLAGFGPNFAAYASAIENITPEKVIASANAAKALADFAGAIPNSGGLVALVTGDNDITEFGEKLAEFGPSFAEYCNSLDGISAEKITASGNAAASLGTFAKKVPEDTDKIVPFGENLKSFGGSLKSFLNNIKAVVTADGFIPALKSVFNAVIDFVSIDGDNAKTVVSAVSSMVSMAKGMAEVEADSADGFTAALSTLSKASADDFVAAFQSITQDMMAAGESAINAFAEGVNSGVAFNALNANAKQIATHVYGVLGGTSTGLLTADNAPNNYYTTAGRQAITGFARGLDIQNNSHKLTEQSLNKACNNVRSMVIHALSGNTGEMGTSTKSGAAYKTAGANAAKGFANGLNSKDSLAKAYNAGVKLGNKAEEGIKDALDEHSPSRVFYGIGDYAVVGFVNALDAGVKQANRAGSVLGKASITGMNNAISKVADFVNSGMDSQPTIRPVLDLSDVSSGVGAINGMFAGRRTLSVNTGSVNGLAAAMASRQNGNNEVVSGIKALRKDIANMPRNQYNINGITYDDGSNISSAVESLVRAARIERRT